MMPIAIIALLGYILIQRKRTAEWERSHHEAVSKMNRERSAWRITRQRQQAIISSLEGTIRHQQDVIDELTGGRIPKFFHLN